jgi:hypothetical protein
MALSIPKAIQRNRKKLPILQKQISGRKIDQNQSNLEHFVNRKTANALYTTPNYFVCSPLQEMQKRVHGWRLLSVN